MKPRIRYIVEPTADGRWRLSVVNGATLHKTRREAVQQALDMAERIHGEPTIGSWVPAP